MVVATAVSAPFRLEWVDLAEVLPLPFGLNLLYRVFRGIGPAVGALVVRQVLRSRVPRPTTLLGRSPRESLLAVAVVPLGLAMVGSGPLDDGLAHLRGLGLGVVLVAYALGEELGWRGYLQPALQPLTPLPRIVLVAFLWYLWHLNFLRPGISPLMHLAFFAALLAGSWGLAKVTEVTHSLLFAVAVHLSFNLLSDVPGALPVKLAVLGAWVLVWAALLRRKVTLRAPARSSPG
jgi:membrane protease YdiL (CAAX protease family)